MLLKCGVGRSNKEIQPVHPKGNQSWISIGRTDAEAETPIFLATWCEELTHWKRPWCWERVKVGEEGVDRGWDGWMASLTQWTWVWVNSGSGWWTRRPGVHRVAKSWIRLSDWTELKKRTLKKWIAPSTFQLRVIKVRSQRGRCLRKHFLNFFLFGEVFIESPHPQLCILHLHSPRLHYQIELLPFITL